MRLILGNNNNNIINNNYNNTHRTHPVGGNSYKNKLAITIKKSVYLLLTNLA